MHSGTDLEMRDGMRSEEQEELEIASVGHSLPKLTYAIQYPGTKSRIVSATSDLPHLLGNIEKAKSKKIFSTRRATGE